MQPSSYDHLLGNIYDAALHPENWSNVMQEILNLLGGYNGHICVHDHVEQRGFASGSVGLDPAHFGTFNERFAQDPFCLAILEKQDVVRVDVQQVCPVPVYEEFFHPQELHHALMGLLLHTPERAWVFAASRPSRWTPFEEEQERLFHALLPHLRRALHLETKLHVNHARALTAEAALTHVPAGVFAFNARGQILLKNPAATQLLARSPSLNLSREGRLEAERPRDTKRIRAHFDRLLESKIPAGSSLQVERDAGQRPLTLQFLPVAPERSLWPDLQPAVLVFVNDPELSPREPLESFALLYGLSPAESRVGISLISGKSPKEIADALTLSIPTVRSHLRKLYQKTRTKNQREFVALALRSLLQTETHEPRTLASS